MRKSSLLALAGVALVTSFSSSASTQMERLQPVTDERIRANAEPENWRQI